MKTCILNKQFLRRLKDIHTYRVLLLTNCIFFLPGCHVLVCRRRQDKIKTLHKTRVKHTEWLCSIAACDVSRMCANTNQCRVCAHTHTFGGNFPPSGVYFRRILLLTQSHSIQSIPLNVLLLNKYNIYAYAHLEKSNKFTFLDKQYTTTTFL